MKLTPQTKIDEYISNLYSFKSYTDFEKHLRSLPRAGFIPDYVAVNSVLYTMDEFDHDGKELSYYNKRTGLGFKVWTSDRYKKGMFDAEVCEPYEIGAWRNDITYAD